MTKAMQESLGKSSPYLYDKAFELSRLSNTHIKILDAGCGGGDFLNFLHGKGFSRITGCDGFSFGSHAFPFHQMNLNEPWSLPEKYDFIFALEVIEHLENPRTFFRELHRCLNPGGTILVSTPNNESITSIISFILKGHFSAFVGRCYPAHITPVVTMDAVRIADEVGFKKIEVFFSNQGRFPGTNLHWQKLLGPFCRGRRFSDNFFLRAEK
ncbi:MAG: class I SAM-dependent methyltransferase [Planctomycetaceae bacterium]|nr:class I SAM-dependent methyltransferase [Planctomycetaceae bacterium]